jgi:hypothetical protein
MVYDEKPEYAHNIIRMLHSNLPNFMLVATKVHVAFRRFAVLTWICDNRELVQHVTLQTNTKSIL